MKKQFLIYFLSLLVFVTNTYAQQGKGKRHKNANCTNVGNKNHNNPNYKGFEPIPPISPNMKVSLYNDSTKKIYEKEVNTLTKEEVFQLLSNEITSISIAEISIDGSLNYGVNGLSVKDKRYYILMDYMKYTIITQENGYVYLGVGLRLIAKVTAHKSGIRLDNLFKVGANAQYEHFSGNLSTEVLGIEGKGITPLLILPSEINANTIQSAMQSMAAIKANIYDEETHLQPLIIAVESGTSFKNNNKIKKSLTNNKEKAKEYEYDGFQAVLNKQIDNAIQNFNLCEKSYPSYHCAQEIIKYLKKEKNDNPNSINWYNVFDTLIKQYSWKMPEDVKKQLEEELKKRP